MGNPNVSIVLPTYDRAHSIEKSVKSLLRQTYGDFEIIVVDDASTDQTPEIIRSIGDSRISLIRHDERRGANAARNTGIRAAIGKYVAFQDSDDEWMPEKLARQTDALEKAGSDVRAAFCGFWRITDRKSVIIPKSARKLKQGVKYWHRDLLEGNFIGTVTLLVEKTLLYEVGLFDETLPRLQDWDMVLRLSERSPFVFINEPMVRAYIGSDSITAKKDSYHSAAEQIILKYRKDFEAHPAALAISYMNMGINAFSEKKYSLSFRYLCRACQPDRIIAAIRLFFGRLMS